MLEDPRLWVAVAFIIFIALGYKKLSAAITGALDNRAAKIKAELDAARRLREEAAALLEQYKRKQAEYVKEAETILADARRDADMLRANAEKELKASLDGRTKQAMDRIAQEERQAVAEVRNHVVDISLATARALIADQIKTLPQEELLQLALADVERKIH